jgi:hypothetical protein
MRRGPAAFVGALAVTVGVFLTLATKKFWGLDRIIEPDPQSFTVTGESLQADQDFLFVAGRTDNMLDGWFLRLDRAGRCRYSFAVAEPDKPDQTVWKSVELEVDSATVDDLQQLLIQTRFFSLGKSYSRPLEGCCMFGFDPADYVAVRTGGRKKAVRCFRLMPPDVKRLFDFADARILRDPDAPRVAWALGTAVDPDVKEEMRAFFPDSFRP